MAHKQRYSTAGGYGWRLFLSGMVACYPVVAVAEIEWWPPEMKSYLSPFRVTGASTYRASNRTAKGKRPNTDQISLMTVAVNKMAKGFVWRPWVLQWDAATSVGVTTTKSVVFASSQVGDPGGNVSLDRRLEGNSTIHVLPSSRFPFKASFKRSQDDSSEGRSEGQARIGNTISLMQSYRNQAQDTNVIFTAERFQGYMGTKNISGVYGVSVPSVNRPESYTDVDTVSVTAQKQVLKHAVDMLGKLVRANQTAQEVTNENQDMVFNVTHRYDGAKNWSVNSMGSFNNARFGVENHPTGAAVSARQEQESTMQWQQLNSFGNWRSEQIPVSAMASMRVADSQNSSLSKSSVGKPTEGWSASRAMNLMLGGNYDASETLHFGGNMVGNQTGNESRDGETVMQDAALGLQATYSPANKPLGPVTYRWFASAVTNRQMGTDRRARSDLREQMGQSVYKDIPLTDNVGLNLSLNETGFASEVSNTKTLYGVNHSASGRLSHFHDRGRNYAELSSTDTRALGKERNNAQMVNFQLTSDGRMWKDVRWNGSLTSQWSRRSVGDSLFGSAGGGGQGGGQTGAEISRFANANLSLRQQELFGMRQLNFSSTFSSGVMDSLLPLGELIGQVGIAERRSWMNTVEYGIGKVAASITIGGLEVETHKGGKDTLDREGLILFELRRFFDTTL